MVSKKMNSDNYETEIVKFDLYEKSVDNIFDKKHPDQIKQSTVTLLHYTGLSGEVGELGEKLKKSIRDGDGIVQRDPAILKEIGDVMWYLARLTNDLGFTVNEVMSENYKKLSKRLEDNTLHGSGDNR